jgi:hypothetical protein
MRKRQMVLETVFVAAFAYVILNHESLSSIVLQLQRGAYLGCQQAARAFGTLAIKLEDSYRVKVAP